MKKILVYYDGACNTCSKSITKYAKRQKVLNAIDMSKKNFSAKKEKLDAKKVNEVLHVRLKSGKVVTDIDALIELWRIVPGYGWLAKLCSIFFIKPFAKLVYLAFAKTRHRNFKRKFLIML